MSYFLYFFLWWKTTLRPFLVEYKLQITKQEFLRFLFGQVQNRVKKTKFTPIFFFFTLFLTWQNRNRKNSCFVICNLYSTGADLIVMTCFNQRQKMFMIFDLRRIPINCIVIFNVTYWCVNYCFHWRRIHYLELYWQVLNQMKPFLFRWLHIDLSLIVVINFGINNIIIHCIWNRFFF